MLREDGLDLYALLGDNLDRPEDGEPLEPIVLESIWAWLSGKTRHIGDSLVPRPEAATCIAPRRELRYSIPVGTLCRVRRKWDEKWTEYVTTKPLSFDHPIKENSTWLLFRTVNWYLVVKRSRVS